MTPAELRRRISKDHRAVLTYRQRVRVLRYDDETLLRMFVECREAAQVGKPLSCVAARLEILCRYEDLKWFAKALRLSRKHPPPPGGNGAHRTQRRDMLGHFVSEIEYDEPPLDRAAKRRQWIADGVAPETADNVVRLPSGRRG